MFQQPLLLTLATIGVVIVAGGLIALIGVIQQKIGRENSSVGGCLTIIIVVLAIGLLLYLYDVLGGSYDLNMPFRRAF